VQKKEKEKQSSSASTVVARCFSRSKGKVAAENYGVRGAAGARHAVQKVEGKVGK
jgi:hypothetical protein